MARRKHKYREDENARYLCHDDGTEELIKIKNRRITKFELPDNVTRIKDRVFEKCLKLKEIRLNEQIEIFDERCVYLSNDVENRVDVKVYVSASVKDIKLLGRGLAQGGMLKYIISEENPYFFVDDNVIYKVNADDDYTLLRCQNPRIRRLEIAEGTTTIAASAFSLYSRINDNSGLNYIRNVWRGDEFSLLREVIFPDSLRVIEECAFAGTRLKNVVLPPNLKSVLEFAFVECESLESISIPASTSWIAYSAFYFCNNLKGITVSEDNKHYRSVDGVLFDLDTCTLAAYPNMRGEKIYSIPDGVKHIANAFSCITELDALIIPESVKRLESYAFPSNKIRDLYFKGDISQIDALAFGDWPEDAPPIFIHAKPDSFVYKFCQAEEKEKGKACCSADNVVAVEIEDGVLFENSFSSQET